MSSVMIFLYEWKHLLRNPFKWVALILFVLAAGYGLHNGANLYDTQMAEIKKIHEKVKEERAHYTSMYEAGQKGPKGKPWVDITQPFWAVWNTNIYHIKAPSPAMVYSIGQAEQYGFYKRVTFWASPYDADMAEEIANPERLQTGTLDFAFVILFLLPLVLLILLYNLKGAESEQGFLPLIEVQATSTQKWLWTRISFYVALLTVITFLLMAYGAALTGVWATAGKAFGQIGLYSLAYLLFWSLIFGLILNRGTSILGNTLVMVGVWLFVAFIIPAAVHQWVSIEKPADLMTDYIDAGREDTEVLYDQPDSVIQAQLNTLFPEIVNSPVAQDSNLRGEARRDSYSALVNELMKKSIAGIETGQTERNHLIEASFWVNPLSFFQNRFNSAAQTHYDNYQSYRQEIQLLIDRQIQVMVIDTWNGVKVDTEKYLAYPTIMGGS